MIKNIIFDMGNVLLRYDEKEISSYYAHTPEEFAFIHDEIVDSIEWKRLDAGLITREIAIKSINIRTYNKYESLVRNFMNSWYIHQIWNKNALDIVKDLYKHNYNLYVISNMSEDVWNHFKVYPYIKYFKGILVSYVVKTLKPNTDIYDIFLKLSGLNPSESIFIDDRIENVNTASRLGFRARLVSKDDANDIKRILAEFNIKY